MNIFYNILAAFICLIIGYLLGSIPNGVIIGKVFYHKDPRDYGSHNMGGTNVLRLFGKKAGFAVYILDFLKAGITIWGLWALLTFVQFNGKALIPTTEMILNGNVDGYIIKWPVYWLGYMGVGIGHCWPIFVGFKGGKAAAVTFSGVLFSCWFATIAGIITFFTTLKAKKYVSLASLLTACVGLVCCWLTCIPNFGAVCMNGYLYGLCPGWEFALAFTINALILIYRHKANIIRLKNHNENPTNY